MENIIDSEISAESKETRENIGSRIFWINKLRGLSECSYIQFYSNEINNLSGKGVCNQILHEQVSISLFTKCKDSDIAIFIYLSACLKILIKKYNSVNDITLVTPPACNFRINDRNEQVLIRSDVHNDHSFRELLSVVKKNILEAYQNQNFDIKTLFRDSLLEKGDFSINKSVGCSFENLHKQSDIKSDLYFRFRRDNNSLSIVKGKMTHFFVLN